MDSQIDKSDSCGPEFVRIWMVAAVFAGLLIFVGCENTNVALDDILSTPVEISLNDDIQPIFTLRCAIPGCHSGPSPQVGLDLTTGNMFDPITGSVGVTSVEAPPLLRIEPGQADASYLVSKLEGTQIADGGAGANMPLGGAPLSPEAIALIRMWIDAGALDN